MSRSTQACAPTSVRLTRVTWWWYAGASRESVLRSSEQVSTVLQAQVDQGELAGFESPSRYLPSIATQRARQSSLPSPQVLETRLAQAVQGLPLRAQLFAPFLADVAAARSQPLLQAADLEHTSMAMAVDALLIRQGDHWSALLPLTAPKGAGINASRIRAALERDGIARCSVRGYESRVRSTVFRLLA